MNDRHAARIDRLRRLLAGMDHDAIVVSSTTNVGYLTGFTGDSTPLLVTRDRAIAVSDFRYAEALGEECPGLETHIRPVARKLWAAVAEVVDKLGVKHLAFEANAMLVADQIALRDALPAVAIAAVFGRVESLRAVKDDGEVAAVRAAIRAAERAFRMLRDGLDPRESELQTAELLESFLKRCGSSRPAFDPIVAAGPRSALPHATPTVAGSIGEHPFVLVDWGATVTGYRSDLTRMIVTGNVGEEFGRIYRTVLDAQARAIAAIRPGARASDVDAAARTAIEEAGFGKLFGHGLGHGIGLAVHESPSLRPDSDDVLLPGMIVTVEPGIYRPGWGGIRIEDDILVTPDGREVLTSLPKSMESLTFP